MIEFEEPISPEGLYRREQILRLAKRAARARRRRRRSLPAAAMVSCLLLAALFLVQSHRQNILPKQIAVQTSKEIPIEKIPTDPTITDRLSVRPSSKWQTINDDELLDSLATTGQSGGIIQIGDQQILVTDQPAQ